MLPCKRSRRGTQLCVLALTMCWFGNLALLGACDEGTAATASAPVTSTGGTSGSDPSPAPASDTGPVRLVVMYPRPVDVGAFDRAYKTQYLPMVRDRLGPGAELTTFHTRPIIGVSGPWYRTAEIHFPDLASAQAFVPPGGRDGEVSVVDLSTGGVPSAFLAQDDEVTQAGAGADPPPLKAMIFFPRPIDVEEFERRYRNEHLSAVRGLHGDLPSPTTFRSVSPLGAPPPYYRFEELQFRDEAEFERAVAADPLDIALQSAAAVSTGGPPMFLLCENDPGT
jgi:hypothetical protein